MTFKKVEDDVKEILKYNMAARCDDMQLYACYVYDKIPDKGAGWLQKVFSDRRFRILNSIAPYETVSRVRRRLQEKNEELRAPEDYRKERKALELKYKEYARKGAK